MCPSKPQLLLASRCQAFPHFKCEMYVCEDMLHLHLKGGTEEAFGRFQISLYSKCYCRQRKGVFPFNYLPVPADFHSQWLINIKKSLPSTAACFAFPSACGGSVSGPAAWPYYKLIETLFSNTKVNISSHVIPISLQWIPLNRGYWMASSKLLLEFPMGRSCSEPGKWERATWNEGQHGDGRKEGWVLGAATAPESTRNMSNFIKGSLWEWTEWKIKIRFCIAYTVQTRFDILLDYGTVQSYFHMKLMGCRRQPPALEKRHFSAEQERQWCATEDVMQGLVPTRGFISWFSLIMEEERRRTYH